MARTWHMIPRTNVGTVVNMGVVYEGFIDHPDGARCTMKAIAIAMPRDLENP